MKLYIILSKIKHFAALKKSFSSPFEYFQKHSGSFHLQIFWSKFLSFFVAKFSTEGGRKKILSAEKKLKILLMLKFSLASVSLIFFWLLAVTSSLRGHGFESWQMPKVIISKGNIEDYLSNLKQDFLHAINLNLLKCSISYPSCFIKILN